MRHLLLALGFLALWPASSALWAEGRDENMNGKMGQHWEENKEKRLEHMTKTLNLTPDQQSAVKAAMEEKHAKMKAAQEEFKTKLEAILTEEQRKKHVGMMEKRQDKMEKRRENKMEKQRKSQEETH